MFLHPGNASSRVQHSHPLAAALAFYQLLCMEPFYQWDTEGSVMKQYYREDGCIIIIIWDYFCILYIVEGGR